MDIFLLAEHMLNQHAQRYRKEKIQISDTARARLLSYAWPGNVRELRNMMEQVVLMSNTTLLEPHHLPLSQQSTSSTAVNSAQSVLTENSDALNIGDMEQRMVTEALERTEGNVTRAAELLGLSRDTLRYRIEKYRINVVSQSPA